ncbi:hypothetical protein [Paenibacillus prosopidis]|uniref:Uncharacterized protein n=1 Tax=Paenibacillus prosopidis TaxID=630520 RepID=A0A368VME3_9BACL|nr:hypothetical protein [Paenibacillus prosopidis]RCW41611.1 hypothetical protein DFP97_12247 [Paenibacillus prosopidis]
MAMLDGYDTPDVARLKIPGAKLLQTVTECESSRRVFDLALQVWPFSFRKGSGFDRPKRSGGHRLNPKSPPRGGDNLSGLPGQWPHSKQGCESDDRTSLLLWLQLPKIKQKSKQLRGCLPEN